MSLAVKIILLVCVLTAFFLNLAQIINNKKNGRKNSILFLIAEGLFFVNIVLYIILLVV